MKSTYLPAVALGTAMLATGAAHATIISGTGTFADLGPANNGLTFRGSTNNKAITGLDLSLDTPTTLTDFLTISTIDYNFFASSATDNIAEDFSFSLPSPATGSLSGSGTENVQTGFWGFIDAVSGSVTWNNPLDITFADGSELQIALSDASFDVNHLFSNPDQSVDLNATLDLIKAPTVQGDPPGTSVAEPGTLALMAAGFLGLCVVRRRGWSV